MTQNEKHRQRAHYVYAGLMAFTNPSADGPLQFVSFCTLDRMFHVVLRRSPIAGDENAAAMRNILLVGESYLKHGPIDNDVWSSRLERIRAAACSLCITQRKVRSSDPNSASPSKSKLPQSNDDDRHVVSLWNMGKVDLEDMICFIERFPELEGDWLRPLIESFKYRAGLARDDVPELDRHQVKCGGYNAKLQWIREDWYSGAWLSAKGGSLEFARDVPQTVLERVSSKLMALGAVVETPFTQVNTTLPSFEVNETLLRFIWKQPVAGFRETRDLVAGVTKDLPVSAHRPIIRETSISQVELAQ